MGTSKSAFHINIITILLLQVQRIIQKCIILIITQPVTKLFTKLKQEIMYIIIVQITPKTLFILNLNQTHMLLPK